MVCFVLSGLQRVVAGTLIWPRAWQFGAFVPIPEDTGLCTVVQHGFLLLPLCSALFQSEFPTLLDIQSVGSPVVCTAYLLEKAVFLIQTVGHLGKMGLG